MLQFSNGPKVIIEFLKFFLGNMIFKVWKLMVICHLETEYNVLIEEHISPLWNDSEEDYIKI